MTIPLIQFALVLVAFVGLPPPAAARSPRGSHISGIVQKTSTPTREIVILRTDTGAPLCVVWIDRTTFVANGQLADAAMIEAGAKIEVIYHQPFFGGPFVTKVTLLPASKRVP